MVDMTDGVDLPGTAGMPADSGDGVAGGRWRRSPAPAAGRRSPIVGYSRAGLAQLAPPGTAPPTLAGPDRPAALPILADRAAGSAGFVPLAGVVRRNRIEVLSFLLGGPLLQRNPIGNLRSLDYQLSIFGLPAARFGLLTRIVRTPARAS